MSSKRLHPKYERITHKWGNMRTRRDLGEKIDSWLNIFPDDRKDLLLQLLSNFNYYSEELVKEKAKALYDIFLSQFTGDLSEVLFVKILNDHTTAHSDIFYTQFWMTNGLINNTVNDLIPIIGNDVPDTLVIVDDFSGSGMSLMSTIDKILQVNPDAKDIEYYFLVLHTTELAKKAINDYGKNVGLNIKIYSLECSEEAFKEGYIFPIGTAESKKKEYAEIYDEYKLKQIYKFGFHNVSSLAAFYYNTPNNTLGLFWQDIDDREALFKRDIIKRNTHLAQMIESSKQRQDSRTIVIYGVDRRSIQIMLEYCVEYGKGFSVIDFMEKFDLVSSQANAILRSFILKGYLIENEGVIMPSEMLKSNMFITRSKIRWRQERRKKSSVFFDTHSEYIPIKFGKEK